MVKKISGAMIVLVLLVGCGTLKIDVDFGEVTPAAGSGTPSAPAVTDTEVSTPAASSGAGSLLFPTIATTISAGTASGSTSTSTERASS